jgi:hypothetical protein
MTMLAIAHLTERVAHLHYQFRGGDRCSPIQGQPLGRLHAYCSEELQERCELVGLSAGV